MDEHDKTHLLWLIPIAGVLLLMSVAIWQRDTIRVEAVQRGHAEWVVDAHGNTKWRWKEIVK